jgi:NADPH-dependent ferric siderophore reductase
VIGLGVANDWVRRAAAMDTIVFTGKRMNKSSWKPSFVELSRYSFAWSGINAIFARDELLKLIGTIPHPNGELARFRVLFDAAAIPTADLAIRETTLHAILTHPVSTRVPAPAAGTVVTTLYALNARYIPHQARDQGTGKLIKAAASSGNMSKLDLPTLLYAFRNWAVHGNALYGAFGSKPRIETYIEVLSETLAEVHSKTASLLLARL